MAPSLRVMGSIAELEDMVIAFADTQVKTISPETLEVILRRTGLTIRLGTLDAEPRAFTGKQFENGCRESPGYWPAVADIGANLGRIVPAGRTFELSAPERNRRSRYLLG